MILAINHKTALSPIMANPMLHYPISLTVLFFDWPKYFVCTLSIQNDMFNGWKHFALPLAVVHSTHILLALSNLRSLFANLIIGDCFNLHAQVFAIKQHLNLLFFNSNLQASPLRSLRESHFFRFTCQFVGSFLANTGKRAHKLPELSNFLICC